MNLKSSPLARAHVKNFMDLPHQSNIALIDWFLLLLWWKALTLRWPEKIVKSSLLVTFRNLKGRKLAPQNPLIKLGFESARLLVDQLHFNVKKGHFVIFAYIHAKMRMDALKKLDFSQLWVWKKAVYALFTLKSCLVCWQKSSQSQILLFSVGLH